MFKNRKGENKLPKEKKNLLKNLKVNSVDLCRQGANQEAHICLTKSAEDESFIKRLIFSIARAIGMTAVQLTDFAEDAVMLTKSETIKDAMTKSFESILADESLSEEERKEMIQKNVNDFYEDVEELTKSNMEMEKNNQYQEESEEKELDRNVEKMSPEDKAVFESLIKKYFQVSENEEGNKGDETKETEQPSSEIAKKAEPANTEMKKALEELKATKTELEELKKSLELKELETVAKEYEIIGKNPKELAAKLYTLKKLGESGYQEYLSILDESKEMQEQTGLFKEIGSNRNGGAKNVVKQLQEKAEAIRKANNSITAAQAFVRACDENPELKAEYENQ